MAPADRWARLRLEREVERWRRQDRRPRLWWRDDDAKAPSDALARLLNLANGRPITLAVIPSDSLPALAGYLKSVAGLTVAQHGADHVNRRPPGAPPNEYLPEADAVDVGRAIAAGRLRMAQTGLEPFLYVPPWNQVDDRLLEALPFAGYRLYSADLEGGGSPDLVQIGAQLDIMRWGRAQPCFRGEAPIWDSLRRRLRRARKAGAFDRPIGLLTHHLAHDAPAWRFLETFVAFADEGMTWTGIESLSENRAATRD